MVLSTEEVHEIASIIAHQENLRVTFSESLKGGLKVGLCVVVCGLLLGPPGFAIGGIAGGIYATCTSKKFRPVHELLAEMTPEQRRLLQKKFVDATKNISYTDAATFLALMAGDGGVKVIVIQLIKDFVMSELKQHVS